MNIAAELVREVRIESRFTPALVIRDPFADSPPSPVASWLGDLLRPKVTAAFSTGGAYSSAPYGEPGPSQWPAVQFTLLGAGALAVLFLVRKYAA